MFLKFPAWLLLIWLSRLHAASSVRLVKLSGSHTSATVGEVVKRKRKKKREIQEACFVKVVVYH